MTLLGAATPPWPGVASSGSLILPLPAAGFGDIAAPLVVDGIVLAPKDEFHLTLLDRQAVTAVGADAADHARRDALRAAFVAQDWRVRRTGEQWLLRHAGTDGGPQRHSVIELLEAPALAAFRDAVARAAGCTLPPTPAHVTLYVAGARSGIGLPSEAAFAQRRLRRLA